ncbi:hypothetical protein GCM10009430_12460 [Aquimarina litoralis]|uniref:Uncharacterized protein n=1 Tax=Aquimarina litoralis TaxID=584605 RepID=A0ABP3TVU9_9FLAO
MPKVIIFSSQKIIDDLVDKTNYLSLADYTIFFEEINELINIDFNQDVTVLTLHQVIRFRERLKELLLNLISEKNILPTGLSRNGLEKFLRNNPRKLVVVLGEIISIGGKGLKLPLIDNKIVIYNKLLLILDDCLIKDKSFYIQVFDS